MKKTSMVSITYQYIFSKDANIWNNAYEFEQDISDFFAANGLEADVVTTVSGSTGNRIILIKKIDEVSILNNKKGVDMRDKPGQKSSKIVGGLTKQLNDSFNAQNVKGGKR